jgi:AraC family transcriptional regulator
MHALGNRLSVAPLPEGLKKYHLVTMENARDYLFRHFTEGVSLAQLADHCHVSTFHFSRIFKAVLNTSPHQYLTELRLNHAQLLLQSTRLPVTQVAFQSGFSSLEYFATTFRQRFGCTPQQQRKSEKESFG